MFSFHNNSGKSWSYGGLRVEIIHIQYGRQTAQNDSTIEAEHKHI